MKRSNRLTDANINVLLEQIDNGNTLEFEENDAEKDFDVVNDILEQNLNSNEDIDKLLLDNDEYFKQLENSNFNFNNPIPSIINSVMKMLEIYQMFLTLINKLSIQTV